MGRNGVRECVKCGAPLHGDVCEYCGAEYDGNGVKAAFLNPFKGKLSVGGHEYTVYLSRVEIDTVCAGEAVRMLDGGLCRTEPVTKRRFTLVEI